MSFNADGTLLAGGGNRPNRPIGWCSEPAAILHHMIDWAGLRDFWDGMVEERRQAAMERYLEIVDFEGNCRWIVNEILSGRIHQVRDSDRMTYDSLGMALCWQAYNLFEGPPSDFRPQHSPDPGEYLRHFADVGANSFDFPIVSPPHGFRANTLYRAFQQMAAYNGGGGQGSLQSCLDLLESVCDLDVIPAYDINWFGLTKQQFLALTPIQRPRFFHICIRFGWRASDEQISRAYADATA